MPVLSLSFVRDHHTPRIVSMYTEYNPQNGICDFGQTATRICLETAPEGPETALTLLTPWVGRGAVLSEFEYKIHSDGPCGLPVLRLSFVRDHHTPRMVSM